MPRKKLLLHICCAPDATFGIEFFSENFDITAFFYNPNIHPESEYKLRLVEMRRVAHLMQVPLIEGDYDPERWFEAVRGLESEPEGGKRCPVCFKLRLERTAQVAKKQGFDAISTVLTISPKKDAEVVNQIGRSVAKRYGVEWIDADLKKGGGFQRSLELSRQFELYRQNYCGCIFSLREARHHRMVRSIERIENAELNGVLASRTSRLAGTSGEALLRKEIRFELESLGGWNLQEFTFRFMGWRPLHARIVDLKTKKEFQALPWLLSSSTSGTVRGTFNDLGENEIDGVRFRRLRFSKGDIEVFARLDGKPIPLKIKNFPLTQPVLSSDSEILGHLDHKFLVESVVEFDDRAYSGVLTAWKGEPVVAVTAPLDSVYSSEDGSRLVTALKLLELAKSGFPQNTLVAFVGAEEFGIGFRKFVEIAKDMFSKLRAVVRLNAVGRGEQVHVRTNLPRYFVLAALKDVKAGVVVEKVGSDIGLDFVELRAAPDPIYHTEDDRLSNVNRRLIRSVFAGVLELISLL
ncbi:MAG: hypothetical protein DRQ10_03535 [Candidatus Hydrothermota bacterium]|nr:MAG: hypothetical protein DRQ10_03535 [Candidatus Hydrothermae bacterium]